MYYGDYYRGDYYRGDPGLFGAIGSALKGVAKVGLGVVGTVVPGPVGGIARTISSTLFKPNGGTRAVTPPPPTIVPAPSISTMPAITPRAVTPAPSFAGMGPSPAMAAAVPGGACGSGYHLNKSYSYAKGMPAGSFCTKARRMNPGNVKALRRADRRIDRFVGIARSALKHTNYKVVSRSAGRRGSRGVITRSEAARALRS